MTGLSPIKLMILSGPEQRGQTSGSASYTYLINRAHERLRARANSSPLSESSWRCGRFIKAAAAFAQKSGGGIRRLPRQSTSPLLSASKAITYH
jgi:hypothetical protein